MDAVAFMQALPTAFTEQGVRDGAPRDDRFQQIVDATEGFTTANVLAVLHLAVSMMPADEAYLEVGTYQGRSLCGVMNGREQGHFFAVENFLEFGMLGATARQALHSNLERWARSSLLTLLEGDSFDVLARPQVVPTPVGVYFYDGAHTALTHYLALGIVEPLLADSALVLVDDAGWPVVRRATERYLRSRPQWRVLHEFRPERDDDPRWANGLMLLEYRRQAGDSRALSRDVTWRASAYAAAERPLSRAAWHFIHEHPSVVPALKRLVPTRGRRVRRGA